MESAHAWAHSPRAAHTSDSQSASHLFSPPSMQPAIQLAGHPSSKSPTLPANRPGIQEVGRTFCHLSASPSFRAPISHSVTQPGCQSAARRVSLAFIPAFSQPVIQKNRASTQQPGRLAAHSVSQSVRHPVSHCIYKTKLQAPRPQGRMPRARSANET